MTEDSADSSGPLVSVIVRAAGEGEGLARTLRSVLDQTWGRLLILVVEPRGGGARGLIDALDPPRPGRRIVLTDLDLNGVEASLDSLQQQDLLRILSRPTLVTTSGQAATVVAGVGD